MSAALESDQIAARYRFTIVTPDRSKLLRSQEDVTVALSRMIDRADSTSIHQLILETKELVFFLEEELRGNNSARIVELGKTGHWFKASIEVYGEGISLLRMQRRELIQGFVEQLADAENLVLSRPRREFIVAEIEAAIERSYDMDKAPELPTHEQLKVTNALFINRPSDPETGRQQSIIKFLETGWPAPFIAAGTLSRPAFRQIDPQAEQALRNWVRETRSAPPPHLYIPTKSEMIDRELAVDPERIRAAWRIARAHDRRKGGGPER